jgi:hypothetical protein
MSSAGEDPPENPLEADAATATTGGLLAAARKAAGLELADIARTTRVPLRYLKAIEADDHDALPALPYAQGFVRAFAKAVGLDAEALTIRFRAETTKQPHVPSPPTMAALDERRLPGPGLVLASLIALVAVIGVLSAWGAGVFDPAPPAPAQIAQAPEESPVTPEPEAKEAPDTPVPVDGPLALTASEEVWVRVFDPVTGTVVFSGIMQPGQRLDVPAEPRGLRLWTGRAGALALTLGNRPLPPLGRGSEVLKDVSLTPEDLLARGAPSPASPALPAAVTPSVPAAAPAE